MEEEKTGIGRRREGREEKSTERRNKRERKGKKSQKDQGRGRRVSGTGERR